MIQTKGSRMFGCPACGYRVSSGEEACPRCGNAFNMETRFECPFCGELVERGAKECAACHVNYADFRERTEARGGDDSIDSLLLEIIKLESAEIKHEERRFSCPKCAWMIEGNEESCPKCGTSFSSDVSFQCPICGTLVGQNSERCPECGASFSGDEEARAIQHEEAESSLDEIATAAAQTPSPPEDVVVPRAEETAQRAGVERITSAAEKISSTLSKIKETVEGRPEPAPPLPPPKISEPIKEIVPEPREVPEPISEPEAEKEPSAPGAETAASAAPPKKKTRKLKARPQGAKPQ